MWKSSQEDVEVTGKSCTLPPQHHSPSYSVVMPQGVFNSPAVYQELGHNLKSPSVSVTSSSRTPPRHLPAGLCGGLGSRGRACGQASGPTLGPHVACPDSQRAQQRLRGLPRAPAVVLQAWREEPPVFRVPELWGRQPRANPTGVGERCWAASRPVPGTDGPQRP